MPFVAAWMDLEIITLSEVSQTKTNAIWYDLCVESKKKNYKWTYLQNRNRLTDLENKFMVTLWGKVVGGMVRSLEIDMYILLYLKWITNKVLNV